MFLSRPALAEISNISLPVTHIQEKPRTDQEKVEPAVSAAAAVEDDKGDGSEAGAAATIPPASAPQSTEAAAATVSVAVRHLPLPKETFLRRRHAKLRKQQPGKRKRAAAVDTKEDIQLAYQPTAEEIEDWRKRPGTREEVLNSIPGFSLAKTSSSGNKRRSTTAAIQRVRDGMLDLETPASVLGRVDLRLLVNKATFAKLPPLYQFKLLQLLPEPDTVLDQAAGTVHLKQSALNNEYFSKFIQEWSARLLGGECLPRAVAKVRAREERERMKLDPWKKKHFEPIWGTGLVPDDNDEGDTTDDDEKAELAALLNDNCRLRNRQGSV